ncbi:MAG: hypothetical protein ABEI77_06310 [Halorientalis sp.]
MRRPLLALYGLVALLAPRRLIDFWEPVAFENTDEAELRSWIPAIARFEGLVFLVSALRDDDADGFLTFLGLAGIPALLAPERYLSTGLKIAYKNADAIEVRSWVIPFTRIMGLVYVLVAVRGLSRSKRTDEQAPQPVDA